MLSSVVKVCTRRISSSGVVLAMPAAQKLAAMEREVARLKAENAKLQIICDVQKKLSLLLGLTVPTIPDDDESSGSSS